MSLYSTAVGVGQRIRNGIGAATLTGGLDAAISEAHGWGWRRHVRHRSANRAWTTPKLTVDQAARAAAAVGLRITLRQTPMVIQRGMRDIWGSLDNSTGDFPWDGLANGGAAPDPRRPPCVGRRCDPARTNCWLRIGNALSDIQAVERRVTLKQRDGAVDVVILVIADTKHNRQMLEMHRDELRGLLPLDSRQILASFRQGRLPERNGIVLL